MRVAEAMTRDVQVVTPDQSMAEVARMMADDDYGALPVGENDQLVGMITDRDIVVRGIAQGMDSSATVREVMTEDIKYCFEDDDVEDVARNMGELQVRRLPVVDRNKRLVGVISLGDIATSEDAHIAGETLSSISASSTQQSGDQRPH